MKCEDTVMSNKKIQLLGQQYEDDLPTYDLNHYLLLVQAEISFKAGRESILSEAKAGDISVNDLILAAKLAGIKEVVEFIMGKKPVSHTYLDRHNREKYWLEFNVDSDDWQSKLKEWGME